MLSPLRFYSPQAAQVLVLADQLRQFETASSADIKQIQQRQLRSLLQHAWQHSPFWKQRLEAAGFNPGLADTSAFYRMPPLQRSELQTHSDAIRAHWPGLDQKQIMTAASSGSTGVPVRVEKDTRTYMPLYSALSWTEGRWHQRDASLPIAVIGSGVKPAKSASWGGMYESMGLKGPSEIRSAQQDTLDGHLDWLLSYQPAYLKCSPHMAAELAERALARGLSLPLRHIISQWERISPYHRDVVLRAFGAHIVDRYSCEETGWLALECGSHHALHECSASTMIDIVDESGQPCPVGTPGRVLVTSLQSFVMPILRYELGDIAEWGPACQCGMAMPVIGKLWGRVRHMIVRPDGKRIPMPFLGDDLGRINAIKAFRITQYAGRDLLLSVESNAPLSADDVNQIKRCFANSGLGEFPLHIRDQQSIDWGTGRKREEFVSVPEPWPGSGGESGSALQSPA